MARASPVASSFQKLEELANSGALLTAQARFFWMTEQVVPIDRVFVSYATPDADLAWAFSNFLRLGCDLNDDQVFSTARPGTLRAGVQFTDAIREALDTAVMAVLLLTPSFYESRFCLAETGAIWVQEKTHVPLLVPPIDFHDLDGVQLGEQALMINKSSDLDDIRDRVRQAFGSQVSTGAWNVHKEEFLNKWTTDFEGQIARPVNVPAEDHVELATHYEKLDREAGDLREERDRLQKFTRDLATQNAQMRERLEDAPAAPELEGNETARAWAEAEAAIELAAKLMFVLPGIVREALFRHFHDGTPMTVGGWNDKYEMVDALGNIEIGYLNWLDDEAQAVTARLDQPDVDAANSALKSVKEVAFSGDAFSARSEADDWIRPLLRTRFGIDDPTFELRPVWEALDLL